MCLFIPQGKQTKHGHVVRRRMRPAAPLLRPKLRAAMLAAFHQGLEVGNTNAEPRGNLVHYFPAHQRVAHMRDTSRPVPERSAFYWKGNSDRRMQLSSRSSNRKNSGAAATSSSNFSGRLFAPTNRDPHLAGIGARARPGHFAAAPRASVPPLFARRHRHQNRARLRSQNVSGHAPDLR